MEGTPDDPRYARLHYEFKYVHLKRSALHRDKDFNLTVDYVEELFRRYGDVCPACCVPFTKMVPRPIGTPDGPRNRLPTVDRIDADLGYIMGNVQVLCHGCNNGKKRANRYYEPIVPWVLRPHPELVSDLMWCHLSMDL